MNFEDIKKIIDYLSEKKDIFEVEIETENIRVYLNKNSSNTLSNYEKNNPITSDNNLIEIKSPMVGIFYRKPNPNEPNFIEENYKIKKGDPLFVIESMKIFNTIESEFDGIISKILVNDSEAVEYNQTLFLVKKT